MILKSDRQIAALTSIYSQAETELTRLVFRAVTSGQLGTASYRQQQLAIIQQLLGQLGATTIPAAQNLIAASYQTGLQVAGLANITGGFTGVHTEAVQMLAGSTAGRLGDALTHVGRQVDDVFRKEGLRLSALQLAEGATRVEASRQMAQALTDQGVSSFTDRAGREWGLGRYTDMVLRTTAREAVSEGTKNRLIEGGIDLVTWIASNQPCDDCAEHDGDIFSLTGATDGYPVLDEMPPLHPNCFPAGVVVEGPEAVASTSRWYDGDLVEIRTAGDRFLPVTPNHPILTPHGFVPAGTLAEGDHVIGERLGHRGRLPADPDKYQEPAFIEDVAGSLPSASAVSAVSVPVAPLDFHGDGVGSEVSVVRTDRFLGRELQPSVHGPEVQECFGGGDPEAFAFAGLRSPDLGFEGSGAASNGRVSGLDVPPVFFRRSCGHMEAVSGTDASNRHVVLQEPIPNDVAGNFEAVSDRLLGFTAGVSVDDFGDREIEPGRVASPGDSPLQADRVVGVSRRRFSGHVHNLQTVGEWYSANGVIVHNCLCVVMAATTTFETLEKELV